MEAIGLLWNAIIVNPMVNGLLLLYVVLLNNFGLTIIAFTFIVRGATYPLTMRQLRQARKMQGLQPRIKEVQERYKNDPQRRGQEVMRLYRETGVNPIGCLGPMVIQMPIWIGLYWTILRVLPITPENLASLSSRIYSWLPVLDGLVPVNRTFLWLDLALSDPLPILPLLAGGSMWVQQKMSMQPTTDPRQQSTNRMMLWMMPIFFVVLSFTFPSGLVLYWVASNLIGIVIQYFVSGWGQLRPQAAAAAVAAPAPVVVAAPPAKELPSHEEAHPGEDRQDSGGGDRARPPRVRRRPRRGRNRRR